MLGAGDAASIAILIWTLRDADFARLEEVFAQFGADDVDCVFLIESDDLFRPDRVAALRRAYDGAGPAA